MITAIWLVYLAGAVTSLSVVLGIGGVVALVIAGIWAAVAAMENHDGYGDKEMRGPPKRVVKWAIAALFVSALLPSKSTLYLAAAATAGGAALQTETGDKALQALNAWLDEQIASRRSEGESQ